MDPLNIAIVAALFALVILVEWADRRDLLARWSDRRRARRGRQVPVGYHRIEGAVGIHFGQDDTTLILTFPLVGPDGGRPLAHVGATGPGTRFTVRGRDATPDDLLAAYDDSLGPIAIQVYEPGRIAEIDISPGTVAAGDTVQDAVTSDTL